MQRDGIKKGRCALLVTLGFPPTGGAGVQRPAKFAKYLSLMGWKTIVWSAKDIPDMPADPSLLDDLPDDVELHAIRAWDPLGRCCRLVKPITRRLDPSKEAEIRNASMVRAGGAFLANAIDAVAWRVGRALRRLFYCGMPDEHLFWAMRSFFRVRRLVIRNRVDVIFSTYSPASNHLLGALLKWSTGVAWVADFRDLWTDDYIYEGGSWLRRRVDRALEQRFLRYADAVVAVSDAQARVLADHVPSQRHKFFSITNGVDLEDFDVARARVAARRANRADRFVIAHVGQFQTSRISDAYIEGLRRLSHALGGQRRQFELRIVGLMSNELRNRLRQAGMEPTVTGYVPHRQAVEEMLDADVLLLPTAPGVKGNSLIPGKLFEYLASGRPILVVGRPECEPWRLVHRLRAGTRCDLSAPSIEAALRKLWELWRTGSLPPGCRRADLTPYTRQTLTKELITLFDKVVSARTMEPQAPARPYDLQEATPA